MNEIYVTNNSCYHDCFEIAFLISLILKMKNVWSICKVHWKIVGSRRTKCYYCRAYGWRYLHFVSFNHNELIWNVKNTFNRMPYSNRISFVDRQLFLMDYSYTYITFLKLSEIMYDIYFPGFYCAFKCGFEFFSGGLFQVVKNICFLEKNNCFCVKHFKLIITIVSLKSFKC